MDGTANPLQATEALAAWVADPARDPVTDRALTCAKHAVLDWFGVALAGSREPLMKALLDDALSHGEAGEAPVVGLHSRLSPSFAALVNGAASHALDYDDINKRMRGHPTVAVLPALLAAPRSGKPSGRDLLDALTAGVEAACIVGEMMGVEHYTHGFHATATVGTIGAAAGVARLLGLDGARTATAIGLAATQAAGLRAMFGTMAKPLHAGKAAMNGLLAARWAAAGLTANKNVLEDPLGFGPVFSPGFRPRPVRPDPAAPFGIEQNIFKRHAACYYTHSTIEAVRYLMATAGITPGNTAGMTIGLMPALHDVCDIVAPKSGLEVKFSIRHLAAMTLAGRDTGDIHTFSDDLATDPALCALRKRITVAPRVFDSRTASHVRIDLTDGGIRERQLDVGVPARDLDGQADILSTKFRTLAVPIVGEASAEELRRRILRLEEQASIAPLLDMAGSGE